MTSASRPSVFSIVLLIVGVVVFSSLGVWQLRRAAFTEGVQARFRVAAQAPLVSLDAAVADRRGDYPHVRVTGLIEPNRIYLLEDQMRAGQLGVMVFVPFRATDAGRTLLVNLGFLPNRGPDATRLPVLPAMSSEKVTLTGIYAPPPPPGLKLGGNPLVRQATWPKSMIWLSTHDIAADLGQAVYPRVLLLDPGPGSAYLRVWTANLSITPARHRAYAFQWFTFAAASIALFFVMQHVKRTRQRRQNKGRNA